MKRLLLVGLVVLVGCQTKQIEEMSYSEQKALSQEIVKRCYAQGVKSGTKEMQLCTATEVRAENYRRKNAPRLQFDPSGAARALQGVSQGYYNAAAASRSSMGATVTCTRRPAPAGYTSVSCY